jgi:hypothetical protein
MAYNLVKGTVEGSVDQHGDQEIAGKKVFKDRVAADEFYDRTLDSKVATIKEVAITQIRGGRPNGIITYDGAGIATAQRNLIVEGDTLYARNIISNSLTGSARGLRDIPAAQFIGTIPAEYIQHGHGIHQVRNKLQVKGGDGVKVDTDGVHLKVTTDAGLAVASSGLAIDATKTPAINTAGQNLSDTDVLLVRDVSARTTCHTTLSNFYDEYLRSKVPHPVGSGGDIQWKGKRGFDSSSKLTYNSSKNTLQVEGKVCATTVEVAGTLASCGAVIHSIKTITVGDYEIEDNDYTVLCDSVKSPIDVTLPAACNHAGRVLIIKKANANKYSPRSFPVAIKVNEGTIDINDRIVMKMNCSSRTLQSDGNHWWVIGSKGT